MESTNTGHEFRGEVTFNEGGYVDWVLDSGRQGQGRSRHGEQEEQGHGSKSTVGAEESSKWSSLFTA